MNTVVQVMIVGIAGFAGAVSRFGIQRLCLRISETFPIGTLAINLSGSFALGWFISFAGTRAGVSETMRLAVATGFLGAYTTFSTLSFESYRLLEDGAIGLALANSLGSLAAGLVAVYLGVAAGRAI